MINSFLIGSMLIAPTISAVGSFPTADVVFNEKLQELLDKDAELENKKKETTEEENQRILNRDLVLEKQTAFKNIFDQLSDKKHELINTEKEFTKTFASVLDKMDADWYDYVSLRFDKLVNGVWNKGGDFYRSAFIDQIGVRGSDNWWFTRKSNDETWTYSPRFSSLLNNPSLINTPLFSYHDSSNSSHWTHADVPCQSHKNYRIESWDAWTPIFSTEAYEQCDIVGLKAIDLSSAWKYWLGMTFEWQWKDANYKMSITARHPYYEELETKRQELVSLSRHKEKLRKELKEKSIQVIEDVKELQLSDDIAQSEKIQELVEKVSETF